MFQETTNFYSDSLIRKIQQKTFLEEHKDFLLAEAKSEERQQECRAEFLDSSVRDLQRQLDSSRMKIYCTNQGYEECRKE